MNIHEWAKRWGLPHACVRDLQTTLGIYTPILPPDAPEYGKSEAWATSQVRLEASEKNVTLFRNNVGALKDKTGRLVRYGLANDTKESNESFKSGDLIGVRPVIIGPHHVGTLIGQIVSREVKEPGWQYTGAEREAAQLNWIHLINSRGGDAAFTTGRGSL